MSLQKNHTDFLKLLICIGMCITSSICTVYAQDPDNEDTGDETTGIIDAGEQTETEEELTVPVEIKDEESDTAVEINQNEEAASDEETTDQEKTDDITPDGAVDSTDEILPASVISNEETAPETETETVSVPDPAEETDTMTESAEPESDLPAEETLLPDIKDEELSTEMLPVMEENVNAGDSESIVTDEEPAEDRELLNAGELERLPLTYDEYKSISNEEANKLVEAWISYALDKYIHDGMTDVEKARNITKCVAEEFIYDNRFSGAESMILMGGGDCWGSTNLIIKLASRIGLTANIRYGGNDTGAGSNHRNAIFKIGNTYYQADAGFSQTKKPRVYDFKEEPYGLCISTVYDPDSDSEIRYIRQYDGLEKDLVIPSAIKGNVISGIGTSYQKEHYLSVFTRSNSYSVERLTIPETITDIAPSAFIGAYDISEFIVNPNNSVYKSDNGALYSKDGTKLISVPPAVKDYFIVPSSVKELDAFAFSSCKNLHEVYLSSMQAPAYNGPDAGALVYDAGDITFIIPKGAKGYDRAPWSSLTVKEDSIASGMHFSKDPLNLKVKDEAELTLIAEPAGAVLTNVKVSSSDTSVADVYRTGNTLSIHARGVGNATITAQAVTADYSSGKRQAKTLTAVCRVTVYNDVKSLYFGSYPMDIYKGETKAVRIILSPSDARAKLKFTSSNPSVASVNNKGEVTGISVGSAEITVMDEYTGVKQSMQVKVAQSGINPKPAPSDSSGDRSDPAACTVFGFCHYNGKDYWYENGVRQGTCDDPQGVMGDGTIRGREIYDPASEGWYWLDSVYDGAKATGKEVWMPYIYQQEAGWSDAEKQKVAYESDPGMGECVLNAMRTKAGKWVRYDENGRMLKGWVTIEGALAQIYKDQMGNTYYYDTRTGLMAKGWVTIDGIQHHFDEQTGRMLS